VFGQAAGRNTASSIPLQPSFSSIGSSGIVNVQPTESLQPGGRTNVNASEQKDPLESSSGTSNSKFTRDQEWNIAQFEAETFTLGMVPTIPPSIEFC
jgi:hypothetical protein